MEELAAGKTASEKFVRSVGSRGYGLPGPLWLEETNANGETSDAAGPGHVTPWFDAAEILDFYCEIPWGRYGEQEIGEEAMQDV